MPKNNKRSDCPVAPLKCGETKWSLLIMRNFNIMQNVPMTFKVMKEVQQYFSFPIADIRRKWSD